MKLNPSISFFFLWIFSNLEAQQNFQKVYNFQDTLAVFNDVYVTDSCYFYTATTGSVHKGEFNFGKINLDGNDSILLLDQNIYNFPLICFSQADMDTNFRGNFVTGFINASINGYSPRVKEFTSQGDIVSDFSLIDLWFNDSLYFNLTPTRLLVNNDDSSYLLSVQYYDMTTDDNSNYLNGSSGVLIIKLKFDGTIIWKKKFHYSPVGLNKPPWNLRNLLKISNNEMLLIIQEISINSPYTAELNWAKTRFIKLDNNGDIISTKIFQDGQFSPGGFACTLLSDGGLLFSYWESILGGVPPNNDYFKSRPVIARFDNNYNLVWKKSLREFYGVDNSMFFHMNEVRVVDDSLFIGAFQYVEEIEVNLNYYEQVRLSQYNLIGVNKWNRDYVFYSTDGFNDPEYAIYDLELTPDGGYIMLGEVNIIDSLLSYNPGQFGYVLKTNCLGFLGDPIAEFSYSTNYGEVQFQNSSIQAGSYKWIFGDGDTLTSSENIQPIVHNYLNNGNFEIRLIAFGCNGISDTISKTITVSGISNGYAGDGTLLTIFPNPIESGESLAFYVGNLMQENTEVQVVNMLGQILFHGKIHTPETTYIIPFNFAAGEYFISLISDNVFLEVEKLIVQ